MICQSIKWGGLIIAILIMLLSLRTILILGYTHDGKEYTKANWFDYYNLTPAVIRNAPSVSNEATYYVAGGDEHQRFEERVTWKNVKDVPRAVNDLNAYLSKQGIDVNAEYKKGNGYFIMHYNDVVIFKVEDCMGPCR